jgi:hypothetical protein
LRNKARTGASKSWSIRAKGNFWVFGHSRM